MNRKPSAVGVAVNVGRIRVSSGARRRRWAFVGADWSGIWCCGCRKQPVDLPDDETDQHVHSSADSGLTWVRFDSSR